MHDLLVRKCGSPSAALFRLEQSRLNFGIQAKDENPALIAVTLVSIGVDPETVSKALSWRDFESFCADIVRAEGYEARENVTLTKPRAQIDVIARSDSFVITMDCKHWSRLGPSALRTIARAQLRRSRLVREQKGTGRLPIASAVLTLFDHKVRFAEGVAIVPVMALRSFLQSLESVTGMLEVV